MNPALRDTLASAASLRDGIGELRGRIPSDAMAADDLARMADAAERLLVGLGDLGAGRVEGGAKRVRHDLRTPLNHVIGYGEMIDDDLVAAGDQGSRVRLQRVLDAARTVLERLDALVEDVLDEGRSRATPAPPAARQAPPPSMTRADAAAGRILIADDNPMNADLLVRRLAPLGHSITAVHDGETALRHLACGDYDLVLLDVLMPDLDGFEVLARLKADPELRHIPVIMITSLDALDAAARCIEMGAADYLTKPFEPVLLQARIRSCLEAKRLRDQQARVLERVELERARARELLRVILPDPVVDELERTQRVKPRRFDNVAVLFCDLVGFTSYCDHREPEEVLPLLQALVEAWEEAADTHGLQKIKTIGDGFMAVAGLLEPVEAPVSAAVACGREMVHRAEAAGWSARVGVHVGPVVAGVLGRRQFQFDLWGDTVNTAARIEQHGVSGVTLSLDAWRQLEAEHRGAGALPPLGRSLGPVAMKGKGLVDRVAWEDRG